MGSIDGPSAVLLKSFEGFDLFLKCFLGINIWGLLGRGILEGVEGTGPLVLGHLLGQIHGIDYVGVSDDGILPLDYGSPGLGSQGIDVVLKLVWNQVLGKLWEKMGK